MSFLIFCIFALVGGIEMIVLYKKLGKCRDMTISLCLYLGTIFICLFTLMDLLPRRFSYIVQLFY